MYVTPEKLYTRMSEADVITLSNDISGATAVNMEVVNEVIATAEDTLNSFVRGRYIVPLTPVTKLIESMVLDLCVYGLYTRRTNNPIPDSVKDANTNTMKMLKMIQNKEMHIGVNEIASNGSGQVSGFGDIRVNKTPADRIFGKDTLREY